MRVLLVAVGLASVSVAVAFALESLFVEWVGDLARGPTALLVGAAILLIAVGAVYEFMEWRERRRGGP